MPPLPPAHLVLDALRQTVLPAAGGAAFVACLFYALGRWAAALGSAAAVVVGYAWVNYTFTDLSWEDTARLIPWKPGEPAWHWLPPAALTLTVVGLVSRWGGLLAERRLSERWWAANLLVWAPRLAAVVVSRWLIPAPWATEMPWLWPALAAAILVTWITLDGITRAGNGGEIAAYLAAVFLAAATVLIYAHSNRFMDFAVVLGCALFGVASAACAAKADTSGSVPVAVGFLPGLLLNGRYQTESEVPLVSFWLVGLAPLMLAPFLIPRLGRQTGWGVRLARAVLVLIPLVAAVVLAAQHEKLAFEQEW